jgi:hypothetical protein
MFSLEKKQADVLSTLYQLNILPHKNQMQDFEELEPYKITVEEDLKII